MEVQNEAVAYLGSIPTLTNQSLVSVRWEQYFHSNTKEAVGKTSRFVC